MATWIDCNDFDTKIGNIGYLVETTNNNARGATTLSLRDRPLRTNQSNEPRLTGWCGETDNKSRTARGVWKVARLNKACDRALLVQVTGADLAAFLADDGHPELIPDAIAGAWDKGIDDGWEEVETVLREQGRDVVVATLKPGHLGWDEGAINAGAHKLSGIPDEMRDVYYRGYEYGARQRAEQVRDEAA